MAVNNKISTPSVAHLKEKDYDHVYEPAEDSFLLLDALEAELPELTSLRPTLCLEVGSGSGIISTGLASVLTGCAFMAVDINPYAARATALTGRANGVDVLAIVANGLEAVRQRLSVSKADLVLCNPPYVATDEAEAGGADLPASWAGGAHGRGLTDRILEALPDLLSDETGRCYMVLEQCNRPEEVEEFAAALGLESKCVIRRRAGRELLSVYKFSKTQPGQSTTKK